MPCVYSHTPLETKSKSISLKLACLLHPEEMSGVRSPCVTTYTCNEGCSRRKMGPFTRNPEQIAGQGHII